jgi:hypothetical protein
MTMIEDLIEKIDARKEKVSEMPDAMDEVKVKRWVWMHWQDMQSIIDEYREPAQPSGQDDARDKPVSNPYILTPSPEAMDIVSQIRRIDCCPAPILALTNVEAARLIESDRATQRAQCRRDAAEEACKTACPHSKRDMRTWCNRCDLRKAILGEV